MRDQDSDRSESQREAGNGSWDVNRNITLIVLVSYVILLISFTIITGFNKTDEKWFDLTKTGFTTLGSALTLILGYYFGQRQVAEELKRDKDRTVEELQREEEAKRAELIEKLKGGTTESQPDDIQQAILPSGRPQPSQS